MANSIVSISLSLILIALSAFVVRRWQAQQLDQLPDISKQLKSVPEPSELAKTLKAALPEAVILVTDEASFKEATQSFWSRHNRETAPSCFVRPRTVEQLQAAVAILKEKHASLPRHRKEFKGLFTVKGGGAATPIGGSVLEGGVVVDLHCLRDVKVSEDRQTVAVGAGLRWIEVYQTLEKQGLAVAGGRSKPVGVAGLALQAGLSFYSPICGFVCATVVSYEMVLADGSAVTVSSSSHPDLFRALKGGANNFGIVTSFTLPCFPSRGIWFGSSSQLGFQSPGLISAYHAWLQETVSGNFDENAAPPIVCLGFLRNLRLHANATFLGYTKPDKSGGWPAYWKKSPFGRLWTLRTTYKNQSLVSAVEELSDPSRPGEYNIMTTLSCKNDLKTLQDIYDIHRDCASQLSGVHGLVLSLVFQPVLPQWVNKGYATVLGLDDLAEPITIVEWSTKWDRSKDDALVNKVMKDTVRRAEAAAMANGAYHRYKFPNYCAEWQDPMAAYGEQNLEFLQGVSRRYDPEGLFQKGCLGGFKLGMGNGEK
ncbi:hypothetical protein S7711_09025 [Stachybotrys chartarum IBT 7711]|uniref:FAD-binding PCMH-type domain-containing protein n=1 Tax=Stachybotrys chartarum (strain CBS 109288 / IBT 7711) TaxID=1280523 RepID=A0A084B2N7_STACB|nr:hypothetical protein S7711_09025 [Stachybotrys chartarum IBT 7711]